jgi:hypothetical protein
MRNGSGLEYRKKLANLFLSFIRNGEAIPLEAWASIGMCVARNPQTRSLSDVDEFYCSF